MKRIIIIIVVLAVGFSFGQSKYFIFFKDKEVNKSIALNKESSIYNQALNSLTKECVERRRASMGNDFITYEDLPVSVNYINILDSLGIKIENKLDWFNAVSAYLTPAQYNKIIKLSFVGNVRLVQKFVQRKIDNVKSLQKNLADDPHYGQSYTQLQMLGIPKLHKKGVTGKGVIMGILDSGFEWKRHESLVNADVLGEYDFVFKDSITANQSGDASSQSSHGTAVFSTIGGYKDSTLIGGAFGASFYLAKTEDIRSETHVEEDNYAAALEWMEQKGVKLTTSSLGYSDFDASTYSYTYKDMDGKSTIVTKAAELAFKRGVLTITAAGNEGNSSWYYITAPADGINTLGIGAVDVNGLVAGFSSRGPSYDGRIKPDISAQGINVYSAYAYTFSGYNYLDGTSLAAPLAASSAALLFSVYPGITNVQARAILQKTASIYTSPNNDIGYGIVSAENAVSYPVYITANYEVTISKTFLNNDIVDENSIVLNYSLDRGRSYSSVQLNKQNNYYYQYGFPAGSVVYFYYTYKNTGDQNSYNAPSSGAYMFSSNDISLVSKENIVSDILSNNYPNPFNEKTKIEYYADNTQTIELTIYNVLGQKVKTLFNGKVEKGLHQFTWNGIDDHSVKCSSGIYIYVLNNSGNLNVKKMVFLK